jgi:hypothetical protein
MNIGIILTLAFWIFLAISAALAWRYGGKPERHGTIIMLCGAVFSTVLVSSLGARFNETEYGLILTDLVMLAAMIRLMITTKRYWPIWANSFQLAAIITHLAVAMVPHSVALAYALLQGFWAYPIVMTMLLGTYGHHRVTTGHRQ